MRRTDSFEKTLILGKTDGGRRRGRQRWRCWMASLTQWTWVWVNSGSWWWTGRPGVLQSMGSQRVGQDWVTELNWMVEGVGRGVQLSEVFNSQKWLSDFTFTFHFHALEKEMATHSSVLAWRIPGTEEPGGLPSMGRTESDTTEAT